MEPVIFDAASANLEDYRVADVPSSVYLIPDFINAEEEAYLLKKVHEAPKPRWTQLANRRLQNWGGYPHAKGMIAEDLPAWLQVYAKKIAQLGVFASAIPNHVLVNEYQPGQGIMPHVDGPVFFPTITTLNLGSHTLLDFHQPLDDAPAPPMDALHEGAAAPPSRYLFSLYLPARSLLIIQEEMYSKYLHGIREVTEDAVDERIINRETCGLTEGQVVKRDTRVSLTVRLASKTSKFKLSVLK